MKVKTELFMPPIPRMVLKKAMPTTKLHAKLEDLFKFI